MTDFSLTSIIHQTGDLTFYFRDVTDLDWLLTKAIFRMISRILWIYNQDFTWHSWGTKGCWRLELLFLFRRRRDWLIFIILVILVVVRTTWLPFNWNINIVILEYLGCWNFCTLVENISQFYITCDWCVESACSAFGVILIPVLFSVDSFGMRHLSLNSIWEYKNM
mgnify:CR=1 FL=1